MIASVVVGSRTLLLFVDDPPLPEPWGEFRVVGEPKPIRRRQRRKEPMKEEPKVIPELRGYEEMEEAIRRLAAVRAQLGRPRHPVRWHD